MPRPDPVFSAMRREIIRALLPGKTLCPTCRRPMWFCGMEPFYAFRARIKRFEGRSVTGLKPSDPMAQMGQVTLDHIYPKSKGGTDERCNLMCMCSGCNGRKEDMLVPDWIQHQRDIGNPIPEHMAKRLMRRHHHMVELLAERQKKEMEDARA